MWDFQYILSCLEIYISNVRLITIGLSDNGLIADDTIGQTNNKSSKNRDILDPTNNKSLV